MDCPPHANVPERRMGDRKFIWSGLKTLQKQLADTASYNNILLGRLTLYFAVESYIAHVHSYSCMSACQPWFL